MGIRTRFFVVPAVSSGGRCVVIYVATQFDRIGNTAVAGFAAGFVSSAKIIIRNITNA